MLGSSLVRKVARIVGVEVTRLSTHRGISLQADLARLIPQDREGALIDAGANVGEFTRMLAQRFPCRRIIAFEPIRDTYSRLEVAAKPYSNVTCVPSALGRTAGTAVMAIDQESTWNRIVDPACGGGMPREEVQMTTLARYCEEHHIDRIALLKTDCEGYDLEVVAGAAPLLAADGVDLVYCEVNFRRDGAHGDFFALHEYLVSYDYAFYALYEYSGIGAAMRRSFSNALWIRADRLA